MSWIQNYFCRGAHKTKENATYVSFVSSTQSDRVHMSCIVYVCSLWECAWSWLFDDRNVPPEPHINHPTGVRGFKYVCESSFGQKVRLNFILHTRWQFRVELEALGIFFCPLINFSFQQTRISKMPLKCQDIRVAVMPPSTDPVGFSLKTSASKFKKFTPTPKGTQN